MIQDIEIQHRWREPSESSLHSAHSQEYTGGYSLHTHGRTYVQIILKVHAGLLLSLKVVPLLHTHIYIFISAQNQLAPSIKMQISSFTFNTLKLINAKLLA
jgi:hypothetical protein